MHSPNTLASSPSVSLETQVREAIEQLGYPQLSKIDCDVDGFAVTLRGELPSYYLHQAAQTVVLNVPGVEELYCEIEITKSPE